MTIGRNGILTEAEWIRAVESPDTKGKELVKLMIAFIYCSLSCFVTAFIMCVVHERVPGLNINASFLNWIYYKYYFCRRRTAT